MSVLSCQWWESRDEGVHLAEDVGLVGAENIVVGLRDADDFGVGDLGFEGLGLIFCVALIYGLHGGAELGFIFHKSAQIVGKGEDGEDGNAFDGVVALHTFSDGADRGRWSGRMGRRWRRRNGLHILLLLLEAFLEQLEVNK